MIAILIANGQVTVDQLIYDSLEYEAKANDDEIIVSSTLNRRDIICQGPYDDFTLNGSSYSSAVEFIIAFNQTIQVSVATGTSQTIQRATTTTPQGVAGALFTVSGRVIIDQIIGEVTTEMGAGANDMKLVVNPTVGVDVDLCTVVDIDGDTVGTLYHITGTLANAMIATPSGAYEEQAGGIVVADGTIDLDCTGSTAGSIKWTVVYRALDPGSTVIVA